MPLSTGDRLGPYEITGPLGEGGMGQVWKARDTRLNRSVAIKTSHKRFSERFEREAQAIAALNHPNVCSLFDVGPDYLVMEYVDGKPLRGPMPLDEALAAARQILDALEAAHTKGIIHRDLKPGNILMGRNGIKVLDFGLAKFEHAPAAEGETQTLTMALTGEGAVLGTLQYMAPEQLEGKEADARSDIFAFGLVLYELLTGKRAFQGRTQASLIASIIKEHPQPLGELAPLTPPGLQRVLETCLEKDPDKRWQSAREIKHALEWMRQPAPAAPAPAVKASPVWRAAAIVLAVVCVGLAGWTLWPREEAPQPVTRFQIDLPNNVTFGQWLILSPDGRKVVINATGDQAGLWIRDLSALEWRKLPGTQGAVSPFWSPDSRFVGFAAGNQLKKIDVTGGPAQTLAEVGFPPGTGSWNRDGIIVFGGRGQGSLWKVSQAGGVATEVTKLDAERRDAFHALPTFLPDGKHFIYLRSAPAEFIGMYAGSLDAKPEEQSKERIIAGQYAASYAGGRLFYMRESTLMAQPFDTDALQLAGEPVPVAEQVGTTQSIGMFSVSPSGVMAYRAGAASGNNRLVWFDRQGKMTGTFGEVNADESVRLAPDGTRAVVRDSSLQADGDLWTIDFARGVRTRFTFRQQLGSPGVWSADGTRIAYAAGNIRDTIYEKAASGAGEEKELLREPEKPHMPTGWSPDGRFLLYSSPSARTSEDIWLLPVEGDRKPVPLLQTEFTEGLARFSPDGRWIAYTSNESGRAEIFVRPFNPNGPAGTPVLGEGKWQISRDGGNDPYWVAGGKEIIFQAPPAGTRKMSVPVSASGPVFEASSPVLVFQPPLDFGWHVTADGKRFLLNLPNVQEGQQTPITVVMNWPAQLSR